MPNCAQICCFMATFNSRLSPTHIALQLKYLFFASLSFFSGGGSLFLRRFFVPPTPLAPSTTPLLLSPSLRVPWAGLLLLVARFYGPFQHCVTPAPSSTSITRSYPACNTCRYVSPPDPDPAPPPPLAHVPRRTPTSHGPRYAVMLCCLALPCCLAFLSASIDHTCRSLPDWHERRLVKKKD